MPERPGKSRAGTCSPIRSIQFIPYRNASFPSCPHRMGGETNPIPSTSQGVEEKTMRKRMALQALGAAACTLALGLPLSAANHAKTERTMAWAPETLSGKIMMVEPEQHLVVVTGPDGIPFDIRVTPSTAIRSNGQRATHQGVDAVEHAAVARHDPAAVLHAVGALEQRFGQDPRGGRAGWPGRRCATQSSASQLGHADQPHDEREADRPPPCRRRSPPRSCRGSPRGAACACRTRGPRSSRRCRCPTRPCRRAAPTRRRWETAAPARCSS